MFGRSAITKIHYVVLHPDAGADEYSVFQGYGPGLLATAFAFGRIASLPLDVLDFGRSWYEVAESRMRGDGCSVVPLQLSALHAFLEMSFPFVCVCSHSDVSDAAETVIAGADRPIHHVRLPDCRPSAARMVVTGTTVRFVEEPAFLGMLYGDDAMPDLTYEAVFAHVMRVLDFLEEAGGNIRQMGAMIREEMGTPHPVPPQREQLDLPSRNHFTTDPPESALVATGFALGGSARPPGESDDDYAAAIAAAARPLLERRAGILGKSAQLSFIRPIDLILAAPALQARFYEAGARRFRRPGSTKEEKRAMRLLRLIADGMANQRGYQAPGLPADVVKEMAEDGAGVALMLYRRDEVRTFTTQLQVRAAADAVPALRLPGGVNLARSAAAKLAVAVRRGPHPNRQAKINRFALALSEELAKSVPAELRQLVASAGERLKVVADAPLEWLKIGEVPLMLRADCSRIPATPGNTSFAMTVGPVEQTVPLSAFDEVLIVRSYAKSDSIRLVLEGTVRAFLATSQAKLRIRVVDVHDLEQFAVALESFAGAMFVFDGHGGAGTSTTAGTLRLGNKDVDLWPLRGRVRVPPIAVLSACDTHAFDGSHGTPAHALLAAGAHTVVSTSLPVDARYSAMFVARLLFRIDSFLPGFLSGPFGVGRWSGILPGLQRMVYTTEMLDAINGKGGINILPDTRLRAGFVANTHINGGLVGDPEGKSSGLPPEPDLLYRQTLIEERERADSLKAGSLSGADDRYPPWLSAVFDRLAKDTKMERSEIESAVREWAWITDALKYVQLGNPERLLIVRDTKRPRPGSKSDR